ncbi:fibronectin type III domain-containing protein [Microbacterium sp. PMB16]|uniref:fibronectin type III domain-containing protein n=1 Tax=Microbacterium sp. PMB16 TaxID=3120157 RepID=UPI003F4C075C
MQVNWSPPDKNGDAIDSYQLEVLRGGQTVRTVTPGPQATSQAVVVETSETAYTYRIRAHNKAGWGEWSAPSAPRRGVVAPGAPTSLRVVTEGDGALEIAFNAGSRGGASSGEISYQYRLNGGDWNGMPGNRIIGGLGNGVDYTVQVRAVATVSGSTYAGAVSNSARGNPHGTPHPPGVSAESLTTQVRLHWNASGSANGRAINLTQISIDGGGWQDVALSGTVDVGGNYSETHTIRSRARDTSGVWSAESVTAQATSQPPPAPRAWVTRGQAVSNSQCNDGTCARFVVNLSNFPAGSYSLSCNSDAPGGYRFSSYRSVAIPANGSINLTCFHGYGGRAQVWVTINGGDYERTNW